MSLQGLTYQAVYQSGLSTLLDDFYIPVLTHTVRYDRAAGYFRSGILKHIGASLIQVILNNGRIRLVTGVEFTAEDILQIQKGYQLRDVITCRLNDTVDQMAVDSDPVTLNLWWLIKNEYLDVKISFRISEGEGAQTGIYHEKFGVLTDAQGSKIVFAGSINESSNGWMHNFESFDVFRDWVIGEEERVVIREKNFEMLWNNTMPGVEVFDFPNAVRERIIKLAPSEPIISKESFSSLVKASPITLRAYQNEAIQAWFDAGYHGILEMATGTGKTITSLSAAERLLKRHPNTILLILCPYTHLVEQWDNEARRFGFEPLKCYDSASKWKRKLLELLADYKSGRINSFCLICTMDTASSQTFLSLIEYVEEHVMVLADEMHNLGSGKRKKALLSKAPYRLGLSATPQRWMDEEGTQTLFNYFGDVVYSFSLARAIEFGFLTPYFYYPILVEFTSIEWEEYEELSAKITKLLFSSDSEMKETLDRLTLKRAQLANTAVEKIDALSGVLSKQADIHHTLIYTSPQLLESVTSLVQQMNLYVSKFTAEESMSERKTILSMFASGQLDALIAMKCLDEGVDVPSIQTAYILASSSNPKEFIQRRGRVLRKAPGKEFAVLYDFIVMPPKDVPISNSTRNLMKKELARFREFSETSRNYYEAKLQLSEVARRYNVLGEI